MVDLQKLKAAEQAALSDLNKAGGFIDTHPRFAVLIAWFVGFACGALATCVHLHK